MLLLRIVDHGIWRPIDNIIWHQRLSVSNRDLPLLLSGIVRLAHLLLIPRPLSTSSLATTALTSLSAMTATLSWTTFPDSSLVHLLPAVMLHPLRVLQHLLPPQLEEVIRVRVELQAILSIVPVAVQLVQWRWLVALLVRLQHRSGHRCSTEDLLVKHDRTAEGFLQLDVRQGHILHCTVQLCHFNG